MIEKKRIQVRRDLEQNWVEINPILLYGEIGFDKTNNNIKIGDGETPWNELPYITNEVDLSGYYTKEEIGTILNELNTNLSNDYYNKEQVDTEIQNAIDNIEFPTTDLSDYYNKEQVDTEIQNAIDTIEEPSNATITIVQGDNNQSFNLNQQENQTIMLENKDFNWFGNETSFESLPDEEKVNGIYYLSDKINYKDDITGQPYIVYKTSQLLNDKPFATTNDLPKEWFGTQEEFDLLETYETNTTYYIEINGGGGSDTNANIVDIMALTYDEQLELINFVIDNNRFPDLNTLYTYQGYILNNLPIYSDIWNEENGERYVVFSLYAHPKSYDIRFITSEWNEGKIYNDIIEKDESESLTTNYDVDVKLDTLSNSLILDLSNYDNDELLHIYNYLKSGSTYTEKPITYRGKYINNITIEGENVRFWHYGITTEDSLVNSDTTFYVDVELYDVEMGLVRTTHTEIGGCTVIGGNNSGGGSDTPSNIPIVDIMSLSYDEQIELINHVIDNNSFPDINILYTYHGYILNNLEHNSDWWDETNNQKYIIFDLYAHPKSYEIRFITYQWNEGKIYNDINEKNDRYLVTKDQVDELIANSGGSSDVDLSNYYTKEETTTEIQNAIDGIEIPTIDLSNYYNKQEIDNIVGLINNELEIIING